MLQYVSTRTGRVAVESEGSGAPVLLLPSNGHERRDFDAIVPELSLHFRTLAIDWPGFGDSDAPLPPSSATSTLFFEVLCDVADALALPPAILIGNSVGGMVSVRFAARRPADTRGIVIVDSGGFTPSTVVTRAFCALMGRERVMRVVGPSFTSWYLKKENAHVAAARARSRKTRENKASVAVQAALWRSFGAPGNDVTDDARAVRCPSMIVWGKDDPIVKRAVDGARARELLRGATYVELDTGHVPFVEDPAAFMDAVLPFVRATATRDHATDPRERATP